MRTFFILAATLLISTTANAKPDRDTVPAATPIGKPVSCLQNNEVSETRVQSDKVIDFITYSGKVYRNTLPYSCPSLGFEQRFLHKTSTNDYCSIDTITVLQSPGLSQGATCGLGEFQPVELVKMKKE